MTSLVERVARALCREYGDTPDCWDDHLPEANVAIAIVLAEAAAVVGTLAERPYDNEPEFSAVLACEAAISAMQL